MFFTILIALLIFILKTTKNIFHLTACLQCGEECAIKYAAVRVNEQL
jgi:hypothetical protein